MKDFKCPCTTIVLLVKPGGEVLVAVRLLKLPSGIFKRIAGLVTVHTLSSKLQAGVFRS